MSDNIIEVKNLTKNFGVVPAVDRISFDVKKGEIFGFLGPNGAGKTTTINILCTLLASSGGEVMVNGFDVEKYPNQVRSSIGIIFQDPSLDERLTAYENLNFHGMIYHMRRALRRKRIEEVMNLVGLYEKKDYIVRNFSRGMKRRLEIARGFMHKPKILFLDEPTTGLDPQTRQHIWSYISNLSRDDGTTIFLTTHYIEEAEICERVGVIDCGKIIALDAPQKLKKDVGVNTLNEVFLKITGRDIRDEKSGEKEKLSGFVRRFGLR